MSETIENTGCDRGNQKNETCDTNEHCKFNIKCGEIIRGRKNDFIIICSDCGRMFEQFEAFGKHYLEQHTVPSGYRNRAIDSEGTQQSPSLDHSKVIVIDDEYIESRDEYMTVASEVFDEDHAEEIQCETADIDPNGPHGNEKMDLNDEADGQFLIVQIKLEEEDAVGDDEETSRTEPLCLKLHMNLESAGPKEDTTPAEMLQLQIKEEIGVEETVNWYSPENSASKKSKAESQNVAIKNEPAEKRDFYPINEMGVIPKLEPIEDNEFDSRMVDNNVANSFDNSSERHANTYTKCNPETEMDGDALLIPLYKLRPKNRKRKKTSLETNHTSNKVGMKDLRHTMLQQQIKEEIAVEKTGNWYSPENSASKNSKAESQNVAIKNEPAEKRDFYPINEMGVIPKLEPIEDNEFDSRMVDNNVANSFDNSSERHANTYTKCNSETQMDGDALIPLYELRAKYRLRKKTSLETNHTSNKVGMKDLRHTEISELPNISKACKSKDYIVPHRLTTIESDKLGCDHCESKFNTTYQQRAHRQTCPDRDKEFRCKECPQRFKFRIRLNRHQYNCHKIEQIILCQYCDEKIENFNVLKEHV